MSGRAIGIVIVVLVILACLVGLLWHSRHRELTVQLSAVQLKTMQRTTLSSGDVRPVQRQILYTNTLPAPVAKMDVVVGQHVHVGQPLLELNTASAQLAVTQAENALAQANTAYQRSVQGYQSATGPLQALWLPQVNSTQAAVVQAQQQLTTAKEQLAADTIDANFSGTVLIASADGLDASGNQAPVLELVGAQKQVVLELSEVDAIHIAKGMHVSITSDALQGQTFSGTVASVAPFAALSQSGSAQVQVIVTPAAHFPVPLGYQVNCKITSSTAKKVPTVPYAALVQQGTSYVVFQVVHGHVQMTSVQLGITDDSDVQVTSGLQPGDKVVVNPPTSLASGQAVNVG